MWLRHALALTIICAFCAIAVFWYAPFYPLDYAFGLPLMAEMREAWVKYGVIDFDFSPYRCLGLPAFSGGTSLTWSFYHLAALALPEFAGLCAVAIFVTVLSYLFCCVFLEERGLDQRWVPLLALGWALQGFMATRALAGHSNYMLFGLLPLLLLGLTRARFSWTILCAIAFLFAHMVYTTTVYLPVLMGAGLFVAWLILRALAPDALPFGLRRLVVFLGGAALIALAMSFAKLAGVSNFMALFPRDASPFPIDLGISLALSAAHVFVPVPWDMKAFADWIYGNWEAYQMLYPGLVFALGGFFFVRGERASGARWFAAIAVVILVGGIGISGIWAPLARNVPFLKSMHVNPRWSLIMVPALFLLYVWAIKKLAWKLPCWQEALLWILFGGLPFLIVDQKNMAIDFIGERAISRELGRALYCYEPIFGYQLELFPAAKNFPLTSPVLVDPRCYLKSSACTPGRPFPQTPEGAEDNLRLLRYELRDTYAPVVYGKFPSLALYGLGFLALLYQAILAARAVFWRSPLKPYDQDPHRKSNL